MIGADMLVSHSISGPLFLLLVVCVCMFVCLYLQKLEIRKATFLKINLPEGQKQKYMEVLHKDFISSESSGEEELGDGLQRPVMKIKPLPWRGAKASHFFSRLDRRVKNKQSKQSLQQTMGRVVGTDSLRPKPASFNNDFWGFQ